MDEDGEIAPEAIGRAAADSLGAAAEPGIAPADGIAPDPDAVTPPVEPVQALPAAPDAFRDAIDLLAAGGPVVLILAALSVLALGIVLAKTWQFAGAGLTDARPVERALGHWRDGRAEAALDAARGGRGPAARALAAALPGASSDPERSREAAWLAASGSLDSARSWLRPLEVIASLAPLLGLFGTVLGMIEAFAELEAAGSRVDPSILSGGIWEALLTTAVGLAVAIPAVAAFNWFERRIERAEALAERAVAALFSSGLPGASLPARRAEPSSAEGRFREVAPG